MDGNIITRLKIPMFLSFLVGWLFNLEGRCKHL